MVPDVVVVVEITWIVEVPEEEVDVNVLSVDVALVVVVAEVTVVVPEE